LTEYRFGRRFECDGDDLLHIRRTRTSGFPCCVNAVECFRQTGWATGRCYIDPDI
jgi:hypothetical protein